MEVSLDEIVEALRDDVPDYATIAERLDTGAMAHLQVLVDSPDTTLAVKSVRLSGHLARSAYRRVLHAASLRTEPALRVSAAQGLASAPDFPREIAHALLDDAETDVRRAALRSLEVARPAGLHDHVLAMALCDDTEELRDLAGRVGPKLP